MRRLCKNCKYITSSTTDYETYVPACPIFDDDDIPQEYYYYSERQDEEGCTCSDKKIKELMRGLMYGIK